MQQSADTNLGQNATQAQEDKNQQEVNKPAGNQISIEQLLPIIEPQLDKDRAMQLQGLNDRLRSKNINKGEFVRHLRRLVGDHMLKMAVYKLQKMAWMNQKDREEQEEKKAEAEKLQRADEKQEQQPSAVDINQYRPSRDMSQSNRPQEEPLPQQAVNKPAGKLAPFARLLPVIEPQLDKDRAMQLQGLYVRLTSNNINKDEFVRHLRRLVGDHMLKMAGYKLQGQKLKAGDGAGASSSAGINKVSSKAGDGAGANKVSSKAGDGANKVSSKACDGANKVSSKAGDGANKVSSKAGDGVNKVSLKAGDGARASSGAGLNKVLSKAGDGAGASFGAGVNKVLSKAGDDAGVKKVLSKAGDGAGVNKVLSKAGDGAGVNKVLSKAGDGAGALSGANKVFPAHESGSHDKVLEELKVKRKISREARAASGDTRLTGDREVVTAETEKPNNLSSPAFCTKKRKVLDMMQDFKEKRKIKLAAAVTTEIEKPPDNHSSSQERADDDRRLQNLANVALLDERKSLADRLKAERDKMAAAERNEYVARVNKMTRIVDHHKAKNHKLTNKLNASRKALKKKKDKLKAVVNRLKQHKRDSSATIAGLTGDVARLKEERRWLITEGIPRSFEVIRGSAEFRNAIAELAASADFVGRQDGMRDGVKLQRSGKRIEDHEWYKVDAEGDLANAYRILSDVSFPAMEELVSTADNEDLDALKALLASPVHDGLE